MIKGDNLYRDDSPFEYDACTVFSIIVAKAMFLEKCFGIK